MELPLVGQSERATRLDEIKSVKGSSASITPDLEDTVKISPNSLMVSRLIDKVNAMPETRPSVVAEYRAKVGNGSYPPPLLVDGLAALIGGPLSQVDKNSKSAEGLSQ